MGLLTDILLNLNFPSDAISLLLLVSFVSHPVIFRPRCLTSPPLARTTTWGSSVILLLVSFRAFSFSVAFQLHTQLWEETGGWLSEKAEYGLLHVCPDSFVRTEVTVTRWGDCRDLNEMLVVKWLASRIFVQPCLEAASPCVKVYIAWQFAEVGNAGIFT